MNLLILTTGYPRWKGDYNNVYLHRLAVSLVKRNINVHVLAPSAPTLKNYEIMDGVHVHRFTYFRPTNIQSLAYFPGIPEKIKTKIGKIQLPFFLATMTFALLKIIKECNIDVINAHWAIPPGYVATITKRIHKRAVLITLYGAELFPILNKKITYLKPFVSYAINKADKVIGISDATCNAGKLLSRRVDIQIVPDGIDTETFNPSTDATKIREKYNISHGTPIIFSSGRMVERKGFKYLIKAMPKVIEHFPDTILIIGGDGPEKEKLKKLVNDLDLEEHVIFPGFISEKEFPSHMRGCDVFVLPSIIDKRGDTEGSATILLEAMACGTPVIGTNVGGIPFAIKNNIGGFLVEQKNPEALAEKIIALLKNKKLRTEQGKAGRDYVLKYFSWDKIAEKYIKLLYELL